MHADAADHRPAVFREAAREGRIDVLVRQVVRHDARGGCDQAPAEARDHDPA